MGNFLVDMFLFLLPTEHATACWGYGNYPDTTQPEDEHKTVNVANLTYSDIDVVGRNINHSWGGWIPPANVRKQWAQWIQNYKENQAATREPNEYGNERQDWPYSWRDLGGGDGGDNPPPWAYSPRNTGLPEFCYMKPERGNCTKKLTRWGFNPFTNECQAFNYSGCGENRNNFMEKLRCEQACMLEPVSGCET